jgi:solute carrier family 13 (sodium-dependent dicarboxylate transporter), member 2/3/5
MLERLTDRTLGFFEWMMVGLPLFLALLVAYFLVLRVLFPPELSGIPGGSDFIRAELARLGPMSRAETTVLGVFGCMVLLFMGPSIVSLLLGAEHPVAAYLNRAIPIWVVPPFVLILLFLIPVDFKTGKAALVWKDAANHAPWDIMLLVAGALAMTDALMQFQFMEFVQAHLAALGAGSVALPFLAATVVGFATNVISGLAATSLFCSVFIPMAAEVGFNPASMAMLIPNNGLGVIFPWAGAAAGTAFATGYIDLKDMIKVGIIATLLLALLSATMHIAFSPLL